MNYVEPIRDKKSINNIKSILKASSMRNFIMFTLGINSGLRISDILRLKVQDVTGDKIIIREKKTGKVKNFPLNPILKKEMTAFILDSKLTDCDYLITSTKTKDQPINRQQAYKIINDACKAVGIHDRIGTHTMRKTFGYHAYKAGTDISLIQKMLNHSAPGITLRYIGITQDQIDDVYINLNL